jgi:hypothetical protein
VNYGTLTLAEVERGIAAVAMAPQSAFGSLDAQQLNWRPDPARWSVA